MRAPSPVVGQRPLGVFQTEVVVDRMAEFLLAAQVTLGGLNRCVAEKELDLLQFSTPPSGTSGRTYGANHAEQGS